MLLIQKLQKEAPNNPKMTNFENEGVAWGGSPKGAVPFLNIKDPPVVLQEGDPPIGKERGALGVGTPPPGKCHQSQQYSWEWGIYTPGRHMA